MVTFFVPVKRRGSFWGRGGVFLAGGGRVCQAGGAVWHPEERVPVHGAGGASRLGGPVKDCPAGPAVSNGGGRLRAAGRAGLQEQIAWPAKFPWFATCGAGWPAQIARFSWGQTRGPCWKDSASWGIE